MRVQRCFATAIVASIAVHAAAAQTIRGTIIDSASGKGVANARVSVAGTTLQATADSLGRFTIAGAPTGDQTLAIHTASLDSLSAGYSAAVTVTGATTTIAVRVPSALQIAGTACGDGYGSGGIVLGRLEGRRRFDGVARRDRKRRVEDRCRGGSPQSGSRPRPMHADASRSAACRSTQG